MNTLQVSPKTVHGTKRGGEDLYLIFSAAFDHMPNLTVCPTIEMDEEEFTEYDDQNVETGFAINKKYRHRTEYYGIEWKGAKEDIWIMISEHFKNLENWTQSVAHPGKFNFNYEKFIGGNAE